MVARQYGDDPVAVEATETAVLFAAEHHVQAVVRGDVVDMRHPDFPAPSLTRQPRRAIAAQFGSVLLWRWEKYCIDHDGRPYK